MAGTIKGGLKASKTNKERYGKDWYARIGSMGGRVTGIKKGFALNNELAKEAGRKGGLKSKRGRAKRDKDGKIVHSYDYIVKHLQDVQ